MTTDPWLFRRPRQAPRLRLFCLPYAGGGASFYGRWQLGFPDDIEVCAVELPGHRSRVSEPPFRRAEPLVAALGAALAPSLDLPFAFFGHSMGGILAFELTRWLARAGGPAPRAVFISGAGAPQLPRSRRPIWNLPDEEFIAELRGYGGLTDEAIAEPRLLELFLPALRADAEIIDSYRLAPGAPLGCPVYLYGGDQDPLAAPARLAAWSDLVPEVASVEFFPGGHFYLSEQRAALTASIARALAGPLAGPAGAPAAPAAPAAARTQAGAPTRTAPPTGSSRSPAPAAARTQAGPPTGHSSTPRLLATTTDGR